MWWSARRAYVCTDRFARMGVKLGGFERGFRGILWENLDGHDGRRSWRYQKAAAKAKGGEKRRETKEQSKERKTSGSRPAASMGDDIGGPGEAAREGHRDCINIFGGDHQR